MRNRNIHTGYVKIPIGWLAAPLVYIVWRSSPVIPIHLHNNGRKIFGLIKVGSGMSYVTYANLKSMAFCHLFSRISGRECGKGYQNNWFEVEARQAESESLKKLKERYQERYQFFSVLLNFSDISLKTYPP